MTNNYNNCIVCGAYSNGKPQCKSCWQISQDYADEIYFDVDTTEEKELYTLLNKKLKYIKNTQNVKKRNLLCNELIGIGMSYVFDEHIQIKAYQEIIKLNKSITPIKENISDIETINNDYRKQHPANIYCQDGHYVRSKEERAIDDYLYKEAKLLHAYEPKFRLNTQEQAMCKKCGQDFEYFYPDFYIPQYNLYIEFFGKNDEDYNLKTNIKIKIFSERKNINFKFLTYNDSNILLEKLEDILQEFKNMSKS